jgi:hypothetical protein
MTATCHAAVHHKCDDVFDRVAAQQAAAFVKSLQGRSGRRRRRHVQTERGPSHRRKQQLLERLDAAFGRRTHRRVTIDPAPSPSCIDRRNVW